MENIKLKPCPFCGVEAQIKATIKKDTGFTIWCQCKKCDAKTVGYCPNINNEDAAIDSIERCIESAVRKWNRRAGDTP